MAGISPSLPLRRESSDGYALNKAMVDAIKQNFKNLVMTSPGERVMIPDFGVGIKNYLFEVNGPSTYSAIRAGINRQVSKYMPFVSITEVLFGTSEFDDTIVNIKITYEIVPAGASDILFVEV